MNFQFSKLIQEINQEIKDEYKPGFYRWLDEKNDMTFTNATNRFEKALVDCIQRSDYASAKAEGEFYKNTILSKLKTYNQQLEIDELGTFLSSLQKK